MEYKLTSVQRLTLLVLVQQRDRIVAEYDAAIGELVKSYGKEAGIPDGTLAQRGSDVYIVDQGE